jgi:hypothetical protein
MCRAHSPASQPKTIDIFVMLTAKPGAAREQIVTVMAREISATVWAYLDGKIRRWYSRGDGKGIIFIIDCNDVADARLVMQGPPLSKEKRVDYEFILMASLAPLGILPGSQTPRQ